MQKHQQFVRNMVTLTIFKEQVIFLSYMGNDTFNEEELIQKLNCFIIYSLINICNYQPIYEGATKLKLSIFVKSGDVQLNLNIMFLGSVFFFLHNFFVKVCPKNVCLPENHQQTIKFGCN